MPKVSANLSSLGASLSWRAPFISGLLHSDLRWTEIITDNFLDVPGQDLAELDRFRSDRELSFHGVKLNLGGTDPLDLNYLKRVKALAERLEPFAISEHVSWCQHRGQHFFDLLPLPYTKESLENMIERVSLAQEQLGRQLWLENPSMYLWPESSEMSEGEFLRELGARTGCALLLDVNNVFVSCQNLGRSHLEWLEAFPFQLVKQIHLAGGVERDGRWIDTHSRVVGEAVWDLFGVVLEKIGAVPTLVEWDQDFPEFFFAVEQVERAQGGLDALK